MCIRDSIYVDYEYLICSVTFEKNDYYIIAAEAVSYTHLIRLKLITYDDLSDFSDELQLEVKRRLEMSR